MGMIKQQNARKAEKALKEILNKADNDCNGKVELKDFIDILEENGVEVSFFSIPVRLPDKTILCGT